jgi:hypothetical protein
LSHFQPVFVLSVLEIGSHKLFAQADLCLLSSWDYRREPSALARHTYD